MTRKKGSSSSFLVGGTSFSLNFIWVATQKSSTMSWEKLKFSSGPMNWTLTSFTNSQKELNLVVNFKSTFNCYTALIMLLSKSSSDTYLEYIYLAFPRGWLFVKHGFTCLNIYIYSLKFYYIPFTNQYLDD